MGDEKNKNVSCRPKPTYPSNAFLTRIRNSKRQIDNENAAINRAATGTYYKDTSIIQHKRRKQYS